jgi:regulator of RNase E activity RraA
VPLRVAPAGIGAVIPGRQIAGRAVPARHYGSVDVFLEALGSAGYGDVLVIDNGVFIASGQAAEVLAMACQIAHAERDQARKIQAGQTLRQQTTFGEYLARGAAELTNP